MSQTGDDQTLDALIERYVADVRAGHAPSVEAFAAAHPRHAGDLRALLPAAAAVEHTVGPVAGDPDTFPGLEVLSEIAPRSGGMGRVLAARDVALDRIVAVKTIQEHMRTQEGREFFVREARAAAGLDHPNIVRVYGFDPDHSPPYYVMQYVDGRTLDEACRGRDVVLIARLVEQIARGLAYAHERGIVHRDVKPANVMVSADGAPHIMDFGLARPHDGGADGDAGRSTLKGTPRFIAPEVYAGETNPGPAIDIYALGATLYELLCGRPAFPGTSIDEVRAAVLEGEPELPQKLAPHVPEPLQRICLMAMEKDPADRYTTALQMAEDLRRFCTGESVEALPKRYLSAVRGRLQKHVTEIRLWHEQNLIPVAVKDRLLRPYRLTLQDDSPWSRLSRTSPVATTVLRLAGMVLLVGSILWPVYYWSDGLRLQRLLAIGGTTLLVNAVGWMLHRRGNWPNAAIFLSTGTLLVPVFVCTVLTELGLPAYRQSDTIELFPAAGAGSGFAPTNLQIALSLLALLWYSAYTMSRAHIRVLSTWTGVAWYLFYAGVLLVGGMLELIADPATLEAPLSPERRRVAMLLVGALPASLTFIYVAYRTRKLADGAWSTILFVGFPLPFAVLLTLLARFASEEWFGAGSDWDAPQLQLLLMLSGAIYLVAALLCQRGWSSAVRFWSPFFAALCAFSLIVPAHVAFDAYAIGFLPVNGVDVTVFELVAFAAPVALAAVGTQLRRGLLIVSALLGFGGFLLHFTQRHFDFDAAQDHVWALGLALFGATAMVVSTVEIIRHGRRGATPRS